MRYHATEAIGARIARGYTLVEVLVASLVFAIGMLAVIAMEFSAIRAYEASRDQSASIDIAHRVVALMRAEAINWRSAGSVGVAAQGARDGADANIQLNALYGPGGALNGNNATSSILGRVALNDGGWGWTSLTSDPVDAHLNARPVGGRYCVYARGAFSQLALGGVQQAVASGAEASVTPLVQVQVAVLYPTRATTYTEVGGCNTITCAGLPANPGTLLRPASRGASDAVDGLSPLERCGWRVSYLGAVVGR